MELQVFLRFLRKRWLTLVAVTLLGVLVSALVTLAATPVYRSSTQLFVSTPNAGTSADLAQGNQFVQQQVQSYSNIATGNRVLRPVIQQLDLKETPAQLARSVSVQAPFNTVLISISVDDAVPKRSADIANAIGSSLIGTVTELEQGSGSTGRSPVSLQTVESAQVPSAAVSPNIRTNLILGLLAGLAAAVGLAVLREALDVAVRTDKDLQQAGLSPLAAMPFDAGASKRPLVMVDAPFSTRAEAFRQLRTGVQFLFAAGDARSMLVTSANEGEGKSTTALNLAVALASAGSRVALIDADLRRPMVAQYLGLPPDVGLTSVLVGQARLADALQSWGDSGHLDVLPAGLVPPNPSELLSSDAMLKVLRELEHTHDVVLVDGAPLLPVTDSVVLAEATGGTLLVVASGRTTRPQLNRAVAAVRAVDARITGAVLTMVVDRMPDAYSAYGYTAAEAEQPRVQPPRRRWYRLGEQ